MKKAQDESAEDDLLRALKMFKCAIDLDIEIFLHTKALEFQQRRFCNTFLILNEKEFINKRIKIEAYFTLSHKTLIPQQETSKSKIRAVSGFNNRKSLHFVLIGQLGKYIEKTEDCFIKSKITSKEILDYAFDLINQSNELIPCKCVLVECRDINKIRKAYEDYDFKYFLTDNTDKENIFIQYYKAI